MTCQRHRIYFVEYSIEIEDSETISYFVDRHDFGDDIVEIHNSHQNDIGSVDAREKLRRYLVMLGIRLIRIDREDPINCHRIYDRNYDMSEQ